MKSTVSRRGEGFSLLEVLIAVVVLSIGLLGIAGLQTTSLHHNHQANLHSRATMLALDMAARMRANPLASNEYANFDSHQNNPGNPGCIQHGCSPVELAHYDLYQWQIGLGNQTEISPALPAGRGLIKQHNNLFTITILWRNPRAPAFKRQQSCGQGQGQEKNISCISVSFQL